MVSSSATSPVVVTERAAVSSADALAGRKRDALVLTAEERRWGRRRVRTGDGRELVLALPTGSVLMTACVAVLMTETLLEVPALVTKASDPSFENTTLCGRSPVGMVATTVNVAVLMTETLSVRRLPA